MKLPELYKWRTKDYINRLKDSITFWRLENIPFISLHVNFSN